MSDDLNHALDDQAAADDPTGLAMEFSEPGPRIYDAASARESIRDMLEVLTLALETLATGGTLLESEGTPLLHAALERYTRPILAARDHHARRYNDLSSATAAMLCWCCEQNVPPPPEKLSRRLWRALYPPIAD